MIITDRIEMFREAARHIWNIYFRARAEASQDWDLRDAYSAVYVSLFDAIVRYGLPDGAPPIPHLCDPENKVLKHYRLVSDAELIPAMINRDIPASGYWDHPAKYIALKTADLRLISLFDWDSLGFRDFRYYRARIVAADDSGLVNRDALIDVSHCGLDYQGETGSCRDIRTN